MDASFIKLPPSGTKDSSSVASSSDGGLGNSPSSFFSTTPSTPVSCPSPELSTHNTARAYYHMKDIGEFAKELESAANRSLPNRGASRYKQVEVLLFRWEEDELQVEWELNDLAKVFRSYGFRTQTWLIPTLSPLRKVMGKCLDFVDQCEDEDTLLIVYYGGHAKINQARQSTWSCTRNLAYSSFEWNGCQSLFEQSKSDTLLLFDCCSAAAAASSIPSRSNAITETIAACGWETWTPEPGRHSFTNALIEVLEDWFDHESFSAAMLHSEILSVLKSPRPKKNREISKTPIYIATTTDPKICSIELRRLKDTANDTIIPGLDSSIETTGPSISPILLGIGEAAFDLSSFLGTLPDKTFKLPHVLLSIALEPDQTLEVNAFDRWLKDFPALAKYCKIQGVYSSYSTLVLVAIPVILWNLLPENPACNFIGYTTSDNLLTHGDQVLSESATVVNTFGIGTSRVQSKTSLLSPNGFDVNDPHVAHHPSEAITSSTTTTIPGPNLSSILESSLAQTLDCYSSEWAITVLDQSNSQMFYTSKSLSPYGPEIFNYEFRTRFYHCCQRAMPTYSRRPPLNFSFPNSGYCSDDSTSSIQSQGNRKRKLSHDRLNSEEEIRFYQQHRSSGFSPPASLKPFSTSIPIRNLILSPHQLTISDTAQVEQFYTNRFKDLQQSSCKAVSKALIKIIEPKKQTLYPYTRGDTKAPPWWPNTKGENSVRHREPDHLLKPERIRLLVHILHLTTEPVYRQSSSFQKQGLNVAKLEEVAMESLKSQLLQDGDSFTHLAKLSCLEDIFAIAKAEERFKNGEIGASTQLSVTKYTSQLEEEDEESDVESALLENMTMRWSGPITSTMRLEIGQNATLESGSTLINNPVFVDSESSSFEYPSMKWEESI